MPYTDLEAQIASEYGLNPSIFEKLGQVESSGDPYAVSSAGAQGLYQIMPFNDASTGITNPFDPYQSANAGAQILSQDLKDAGGNYANAIEYYNCGPFQSCPAGKAEAQKVLGQNGSVLQQLSDPNSQTSKFTSKATGGGLLSPLVDFLKNVTDELKKFFIDHSLDALFILLGVLLVVGALFSTEKGRQFAYGVAMVAA